MPRRDENGAGDHWYRNDTVWYCDTSSDATVCHDGRDEYFLDFGDNRSINQSWDHCFNCIKVPSDEIKHMTYAS